MNTENVTMNIYYVNNHWAFSLIDLEWFLLNLESEKEFVDGWYFDICTDIHWKDYAATYNKRIVIK